MRFVHDPVVVITIETVSVGDARTPLSVFVSRQLSKSKFWSGLRRPVYKTPTIRRNGDALSNKYLLLDVACLQLKRMEQRVRG